MATIHADNELCEWLIDLTMRRCLLVEQAKIVMARILGFFADRKKSPAFRKSVF